MMSVIEIKATTNTPSILMDSDKLLMRIEGTSYPENPIEVYKPIIAWLDQLNFEPEQTLRCEFYFNYLTSSSSKMLYELFIRIAKLHRQGNKVDVYWYYFEDDELMLEIGDDLEEILNLPLNLIATDIEPKCIQPDYDTPKIMR